VPPLDVDLKMARLHWKDLKVLAGGALVAVGLPLLVYAIVSWGGPSTDGGYPQSEPAPEIWKRTGQYSAERLGVTVNIHTYYIGDTIDILYSTVQASPGLQAAPVSIAVTDDTGGAYAVRNHTLIGATLGVAAGVLILEPYKGNGRTFTLTVDGMEVTGAGKPEIIPGKWSVTFIENRAPGAPVTYTAGGRIANEVISVGGATIGVAGPPGGSLTKVLIDRAGNQAALYGMIADGVARGVSDAEFRQLLQARGYSDFPPPPDFPRPPGAPEPLKTALTEHDAEFTALQAASHLIGDEGIQSIAREPLSYSDALARLAERGLTGPGGEQPAADALVWLVSFKGLFYEPVPPDLRSSAQRQYICSEILVLVNDGTGEAMQLALIPLDSCPKPTQFPRPPQSGR